MSIFNQFDEQDKLREITNNIIAENSLTDTKCFTDADKEILAKLTLINEEVETITESTETIKYDKVFDALSKAIVENTDSSKKQLLSFLSHILMKENEGTDVVDGKTLTKLKEAKILI